MRKKGLGLGSVGRIGGGRRERFGEERIRTRKLSRGDMG